MYRPFEQMLKLAIAAYEVMSAKPLLSYKRKVTSVDMRRRTVEVKMTESWCSFFASSLFAALRPKHGIGTSPQ
jgi:hypothetical protein